MKPEPKYRLIAIDLDGTLLCPKGQVSGRVKAAIHQAVRGGFQVCFATGRSYKESRRIIESVEHFDCAVFVTGAIVVDTSCHKVVHRRLMDAELARQVCAFLEEKKQTVLALQDSPASEHDYLVTAGTPLNQATQSWITVTDSTIKRASDLAVHDHKHTLRVGIVAEPGQADQYRLGLLEHFGDRIACNGLTVQSHRMQVLEVFEPAVNKWAGVQHVASRHGILAEQVVAIGDDVNDVPMIERAGLGVAMGNAPPQVRQAAQRVIGHNSQDGLAEFLEELIEEHGAAVAAR